MKPVILPFCLLFLSAAWSQEFIVSPFLQDAEPESMRVIWELSGNDEATLAWGESEVLGNVIPSTGEPTLAGYIHDVLIEGLAPSTTYFYQVTAGSAASPLHRFRTPPAPTAEPEFAFIAMSDMQKSNANPDKFDEIIHDGILNYIEGEPADELGFVLIPGDLVDHGPTYSQWAEDFFAPAAALFSEVPVYPVLGNHEVNTPNYFQYFHLPENGTAGFEEHWWFKDYGNVRLIGLNSNAPYDGEEQLSWLDLTLSTTCDLDHIDFVFAQLHHPHKSELWTPGESDFTGLVIQQLEAFTENCGKPSIHFFGHTHGYSRGQSQDHKHLWINVATAGGAIDYWGEWPQFDYDEFEISTDDWGFVAVEVEAGAAPQFTIKRLSRGDNFETLDNFLTDSLTITKATREVAVPSPISPVNTTIPPECAVLQASAFAGPSPFSTHGESQWQVATSPSGFDTPIANSWERHRNVYFNETETNDNLTEEFIADLEANSVYWWRVRYRDRNLNWSDWTEPAAFATSESLQGDNLLANGGAEEDMAAWVITEGVAEALTAGECNGVNPHSGLKYFSVGGLCTESAVGQMHQDVDVSAYADSIDAGSYAARATAWMSDWSGDDVPELRLNFLDLFNNSLGLTPSLQGPIATWTHFALDEPIPVGTRTIRFELKGTRNSGSDNDSYFDDLALRVGGMLDCTTMSVPLDRSSAIDPLLLYPNPNAGTARVRWSGMEGESVEFRVVNSLGVKQAIDVERSGTEWLFNAEHLQRGVYILTAVAESGRLARTEWIVQ